MRNGHELARMPKGTRFRCRGEVRQLLFQVYGGIVLESFDQPEVCVFVGNNEIDAALASGEICRLRHPFDPATRVARRRQSRLRRDRP